MLSKDDLQNLSPVARADHLGARISRLAAQMTAGEHALVHAIADFDRSGAFVEHGALSTVQWLGYRVGMSSATASEKLRVGHALGDLPKIDEAFAAAKLSYSKVRALTRVATPDNEVEFLEIAKCATASELERICRTRGQRAAEPGRQPGSAWCEPRRRGAGPPAGRARPIAPCARPRYPRGMQQIVIPRIGDPSVLELRESEDPTPGPGQVRILVEAAGINFADLMARIGVYPDAPPLPAVVGYEVAGSIDAVGEGVDASRVGEAVLAATKFGGYTTHLVVDASLAIARPEGMDARSGAALPVTGLTAWMMCEEMGRVREGDRVLIHSAGGGVGLAACDLVKWRGGVAVGTASGKKHAFLKEWGYDELVDYRTQDFHEALKDGPPFDLVLDPVGGASWRKSFDLLDSTGRLVCFGFSANASGNKRSILTTLSNLRETPWLLFNPIRVINANKGVMGVNMGRLWDEAERLSGWLGRLIELWQQGKLRTHVHAAVPFSRAAEAHQLIHDRENFGKVLLVPDAFA